MQNVLDQIEQDTVALGEAAMAAWRHGFTETFHELMTQYHALANFHVALGGSELRPSV